MTAKLKIGEFARLTGLSVKALRFYADAGVLQPSSVDATSGYRFYEPALVEDAIRVVNLREAGISLAVIRELHARDEPQLLATLRRQRASLLKEKARIESRFKVAESLLGAVAKKGASAIDQVRLISIEPEFVYVKELPAVTQDGIVTATFQQAESIVARVNARANRSPFLLIHKTESSEPPHVEICIPIRDDRIEQLPTTLLAGDQVAAAATYSGSYAQTADITQRLQDWIDDAGLEHGGLAKVRVERAGSGDSEGPPCSKLDYDTEVAHYIAVFTKLLNNPLLNSEEVFVFGSSLGSTTAPLVA
ncbi:MAG: MerR family transcriptional regulator [Pseudomonadota bacterium]